MHHCQPTQHTTQLINKTLYMNKADIRREMRAIKKNIGKARLLELSAPTASLVEKNSHYQVANIVMLYYPLWDEVDCRQLMERTLAAGKRVILPTVVGDDIVPVEITADTEWRVGEYNIMEPIAEKYVGDIDLIVVPGMAFDSKGNRLGRGKGYYDRFLCQHSNAYRLGLCFSFQMIESVPTEPFDFVMNDIVVVPAE